MSCVFLVIALVLFLLPFAIGFGVFKLLMLGGVLPVGLAIFITVALMFWLVREVLRA